MKSVIVALLFLVAACGTQMPLGETQSILPSASPVTETSVPGQETHGGDLAVAMVRSTLMGWPVDPRVKPLASRLMTTPMYSVAGDEAGEMLGDKGNVFEVNRARVMKMIPAEIPYELLGALTAGRPLIINYKVRPHNLGRPMTPEEFREKGKELFTKLERCLHSHYSVEYLFPSFTIEEIEQVEVGYSSQPLIDKKLGKRVDVGVTLEESPRVLIDPERAQGWTVTNYATDYLVFHEYAHVLLKKAGRSDDDHLVASMLYYQCSSHSKHRKLDLMNH